MLIRLQKILAQSGIAARRKCEDIIRQGRVRVNGKTASIGENADPEKDTITIDDIPIKKEKKVYYLLNKPKGYVTTVTESHGMKTIMNLIHTKERIFPVGRLDKDTEGLIILTNDGDLANKLTHPKHDIKKTYIARVDKTIQDNDIDKLNKGIIIEGRKTTAQAQRLDKQTIEITLHEGRKHIVRKLLQTTGYEVQQLTRTKIGPLILKDIQQGKYRELTKEEIEKLKQK